MVVAMEIVVLMVDLEVAVASRKLNLFHVLVEHINKELIRLLMLL